MNLICFNYESLELYFTRFILHADKAIRLSRKRKTSQDLHETQYRNISFVTVFDVTMVSFYDERLIKNLNDIKQQFGSNHYYITSLVVANYMYH